MRESLFNIIEHTYGGVADMRVIDLFAGTGALALEALSRGARFALMVEDGAEARALIRENIETLGLGGATRIFRRDARKLGDVPPGPRFDLAFLDPPYGQRLAETALLALAAGNWLGEEALVVVEEASEAVVEPPGGYRVEAVRAFGDTQIILMRSVTAAEPRR